MGHAPVEVFRRLTNGVYVIGVRHGDQQGAFTAAWVTQVSFDPLLIGLSINPGHASFPLLVAAGGFAVSVLPSGALNTARHFGTHSARSFDKFAGQQWSALPSGAPVLSEAVAQLQCEVVARHPAGDHVLVLARVVGGTVLRPEARPMDYAETGNLDGSAALYPARF
jgi:flavin reductase (DIM6/NTAB) family NADH-FMN oxidoreductase RutF